MIIPVIIPTTHTHHPGQSTTDEMGFAVLGILRDNPPDGGKDFLKYLEKLLEAEALKKLLGGTVAP